VGVEHVTTNRGGSTFSQTAAHLGAARYLFERVYVGAGVGLAWVRESRGLGGLGEGPGFAYSLLLGGELLQGDHVAVSAELAFTMGHYRAERWEMGGFRLGLALY
jgi:hypothetical protein